MILPIEWGNNQSDMSNCLAVTVVWYWEEPQSWGRGKINTTHCYIWSPMPSGLMCGITSFKISSSFQTVSDFECKDYKVALLQPGLGRWERLCQNISLFWQGQLCLDSLIRPRRSAQIIMNNYQTEVQVSLYYVLRWSFENIDKKRH